MTRPRTFSLARAMGAAGLVVLTCAGHALAAQAPRHQTVVQSYDPSEDALGLLVATPAARSLQFSAPAWARSASIIVKDASGPVIFRARWGNGDWVNACSTYPPPPWPSKVLHLKGASGTLEVQPIVGQAPMRGACPVIYASAPTTGTVKVVFSSRER